jgi:hypothetical protein
MTATPRASWAKGKPLPMTPRYRRHHRWYKGQETKAGAPGLRQGAAAQLINFKSHHKPLQQHNHNAAMSATHCKHHI